MKVRWLAGQPPAWWVPSALLVSNYAPGVPFLIGLFGQLTLKLVDALLELLDLESLTFIFACKSFDDLSRFRHLVHVPSISCVVFGSVSLAVTLV